MVLVTGTGVLVAPGMATGAVELAGQPPPVAWGPCPELPADEGVRCGTVRVPIDWGRPHGAWIDLAVARRPAGDPSARVGALMFNNGGPYGSGVNTVLFNVGGILSEDVRRRFDVVGIDPRGVGRSHPVLCSSELLARATPFALPGSQADLDAIVANNTRLREDCRNRTGPLFDHVNTLNVARDLDWVRAAVGEPKLTFYGRSYGTLLGLQYAEQFPHRVRAIVSDSILDHSLDTRALLDAGAVTVQDSFDEFVAWCDRTANCVLRGRDVRAVWHTVLDKTERGEIPHPVLPRPLQPGELNTALANLSREPDWTFLAQLLVDFETGTPVELEPPPEPPPVVAEPERAFRCVDWRLPVRDYRELAAHLRASARLAPDLRYSYQRVQNVLDCLGTPSVPNPQHRLRVRNSPPLLVVQPRHDPAGGYAMGVNVVRQLGRQGVLLTYEGQGHVAYGRTPCVDDAVDRYLISLTRPEPGARCPAVPPA